MQSDYTVLRIATPLKEVLDKDYQVCYNKTMVSDTREHAETCSVHDGVAEGEEVES